MSTKTAIIAKYADRDYETHGKHGVRVKIKNIHAKIDPRKNCSEHVRAYIVDQWENGDIVDPFDPAPDYCEQTATPLDKAAARVHALYMEAVKDCEDHARALRYAVNEYNRQYGLQPVAVVLNEQDGDAYGFFPDVSLVLYMYVNEGIGGKGHAEYAQLYQKMTRWLRVKAYRVIPIMPDNYADHPEFFDRYRVREYVGDMDRVDVYNNYYTSLEG